MLSPHYYMNKFFSSHQFPLWEVMIGFVSSKYFPHIKNPTLWQWTGTHRWEQLSYKMTIQLIRQCSELCESLSCVNKFLDNSLPFLFYSSLYSDRSDATTSRIRNRISSRSPGLRFVGMTGCWFPPVHSDGFCRRFHRQSIWPGTPKTVPVKLLPNHKARSDNARWIVEYSLSPLSETLQLYPPVPERSHGILPCLFRSDKSVLSLFAQLFARPGGWKTHSSSIG